MMVTADIGKTRLPQCNFQILRLIHFHSVNDLLEPERSGVDAVCFVADQKICTLGNIVV